MVVAALGTLINNSKFGLFRQEATEIDGLTGVIDLYPQENHRLKVSKTNYPIETGSSRTDNAVVEPKSLILQGWVSDLQPLKGGIVTIPGPGRGVEAWSRVIELMEALEPVTVVTTLFIYSNMLITAVDAPVDENTGRTLKFTMTLDEILIAESEVVELPASQLSGPADTKGSVEEGGLKQSEDSQSSLLKSSVSKLSNLFGG